MADPMKCGNPDISRMLPWLINGTLAPGDAKRVSAHVDQCAVCKEKMGKMQRLSAEIENSRETLFSGHILPEMLVNYVEARSELKRDDIASIEAHLKMCRECRSEMEILKKVNESLPLEPVGESFWDRMKARLSFRLINFPARPVWIYVVILVLLYPAYMGISNLFVIHDFLLKGLIRSKSMNLTEPNRRSRTKLYFIFKF